MKRDKPPLSPGCFVYLPRPPPAEIPACACTALWDARGGSSAVVAGSRRGERSLQDSPTTRESIFLAAGSCCSSVARSFFFFSVSAPHGLTSARRGELRDTYQLPARGVAEAQRRITGRESREAFSLSFVFTAYIIILPLSDCLRYPLDGLPADG